MGSYETNVYLDNNLIKKIEVKNSTPLSDIRTSLENNDNFHKNSYKYYFLSKDGVTLKSDANFTAKDVATDDYKIKIISEQFSFKANIYIDNNLIRNINVEKSTKLSKLRELCSTDFNKEKEDYYFVSSKDEILKHDSDFTVEKVWVKESNNEYKIKLKSEKRVFKVKVNIDENFTTYINITKDCKLNDIRELCNSFFHEGKNYYFVLESKAIIKNDSNLTAESIMRYEHNEFKINFKSEDITLIVTVFLNEIKQSGISCNINQSLIEIKNKLGQDINKNEIFFLTPQRAIIENYNLGDFKLKNIIVYQNNEPIINIIDKSYRPKFEVIEQLELLRAEASAGPINWHKRTEFFKKVEDFAGFEIATILKDELIKNFDPKNEKKANDKEFINAYMILLLKKEDIKKMNLSKNVNL